MVLGNELVPAGDPKDEGEEEEDEEELEDPLETLKEDCSKQASCVALREIFDKCTKRVSETEGTDETCEEELFDLVHCIDDCATKAVFGKLV